MRFLKKTQMNPIRGDRNFYKKEIITNLCYCGQSTIDRGL